MEPISTAFGVIAAFKDVYSTAIFIRDTIHTIKHFRTEQSSLTTQFDFQILRLSEYSKILGGGDRTEPNINFLESVKPDYLQIAQKQLAELQKILAEYTRLAATKDNNGQTKQTPDAPKPSAQMEDTDSLETKPTDVNKVVQEGKPNQKGNRKGWSFFNISLGTSKSNKGPKERSPLTSLPPGVQWLFTKEKEWNDDLEGSLGLLLRGFGITADQTLQDRLQLGGGNSSSVFAGHIALSNLSKKPEKVVDEISISWESAESLIKNPRILVEEKTSGIAVTQGSDEKISSVMRETYAPQLAQLLRTAGNYKFGTLRLNAYAWDLSRVKCAFLFDYPDEASEKPPKSLHDLILNEGDEASFKLDLKQRFLVARLVARSIGAFHSDDWLHKSIRAHAIKFFSNKEDSEFMFGSPFLTDFEMSRPVAAGTRLLARALDIEYDVYRHPQRYGPPTVSFTKIHDIYSLGVVLLEIGLWQTAKEIHDDIVDAQFNGVCPTEGVPGNLIRETFLRYAETRLGHRMGSSYQEAVVTCLSRDLEDHLLRDDFASEFQKRVVAKVDIKALTN
ncbi:hypothetical protein ACMFMG_007838 [Clarireedia jacksonii]